MCKKLILMSLVFAFAFAAAAQAATVVWVSDDKGADGTDQGWIDLLVDNGYNVNLDFRSQQGRTLDAAEIDALNAADLVIFSRDTSSGDYNGAAEIAQWNTEITTPLICLSAYQYRSSRWIWMNSTSTGATTAPLQAVMPEHPIFEGVTLDGSNQVQILTAQSNVGNDNVDPTNNYTLIATRSDAGADGVWIATWEKGVEFYPGSGQITGGPRMYFAAGGSEGDNVDGRYNLTAEGEKLFLNAVEYYTGVMHFASDPDPKNGSSVPSSAENDDGSIYMIMTFTPGDDAVSHNAYFSDNYDDVANRVPDVSIGAPPFAEMPNSYYVGMDDANLPDYAREEIFADTTYYWCVDESNGVEEFPGTVWSFYIIPEHAWNPTPEDGDVRVEPDPNVITSWQMGAVDTDGQALSYNVYYGTVLADVEAETAAMVTVSDPTAEIGPLEDNTTYYWKVNTVLTMIRPPFTQTVFPGPVWQFRTLPVVTPEDEDLIGWWKLDGDMVPGLAFDSSGYANHGTLMGDPQFVPGKVDNAIELDGDGDYVDCGNAPIFNDINDTITVAAWIQVDTFDTSWQAIVTKGDNSWRLHRWGTNNSISWNCNGVTGGSLRASSDNIGIDDGEWYHLAALYDGAEIALYINGDLNNSQAASGSIAGNAHPVMIGENAQQAGRHWFGLIDDARLYKRALSAKEIQILAGRLGASSPDPANGATDVSRTPTLNWAPGVFAAATNGNILYYGEDAAAVAARTATNVMLTDPTYTLPLTLDLGQTFYWAVDTVNGAETWPGDVWGFTAASWLLIDDMETYTPYDQAGNNIFEAYRDGMGNCVPGNGNDTGANLTENTDMAYVFTGLQSMMYDYDNDGTVWNPCGAAEGPRSNLYSKIEAQVAGLPGGIGTNWTIQGVKALSLRFYGQATNDIEPMWVQLNGGAKITYGDYDDEDPADITEEEWHEWFIDLADFGVTLSNVTTFAIGFGTEDATEEGGSGTVYFDDFRLYTPVCRPSRHTAAMAKLDFAPLGAPDCVVDYEEIDVMSDDWLLTDAVETGELLLHWKFDETAGTTATDSSGNGRNGDVNDVNGISWTYDAERGRCLDFQGGDHVLDNDANTYLDGLRGITISLWVKNRETAATDQGFIIMNDPDGGDNRDMRYDAAGANADPDGQSVIKCGITTDATVGNPIQQIESSENAQTTAWQHLALTWSTGEQLRLYIDGDLDTPTANRPGTYGVTTGVTKLIVGKGGKDEAADAGWNGLIDDVQIYNYALSEADINTVKNGGTIPPQSVHYPVPSSADVAEEAAGDGAINFKDYAELLKNWLVEVKYPQ